MPGPTGGRAGCTVETPFSWAGGGAGGGGGGPPCTVETLLRCAPPPTPMQVSTFPGQKGCTSGQPYSARNREKLARSYHSGMNSLWPSLRRLQSMTAEAGGKEMRQGPTYKRFKYGQS
jgi:hypothetical protein